MVRESELVSFIEGYLKADRTFRTFDEATAKQRIVLRVFSLLGWDIFNEAVPEFSVGGRRVDYSLRVGGVNKVFVEVKKPGEELDNHQEQLLGYSFQEGVGLAVLTNGATWWFYLPLHEGSWEQRRFYAIDVIQQDSKDAASKFVEILSRDNVASGKAIENARSLLESRQKLAILNGTLPRAWDRLVDEPDGLLIELLSDATENLCGFRPDAEMVEHFLRQHRGRFLVDAEQVIQPSRPRLSQLHTPTTDTRRRTRQRSTSSQERTNLYEQYEQQYVNRRYRSFVFNGVRYGEGPWIDVLVKVAEILNAEQGKGFSKVLALRGSKWPYFSLSPNEEKKWKRIGDSGFYVYSQLNAGQIVERSHEVMSLFGYPLERLVIDLYPEQ